MVGSRRCTPPRSASLVNFFLSMSSLRSRRRWFSTRSRLFSSSSSRIRRSRAALDDFASIDVLTAEKVDIFWTARIPFLVPLTAFWSDDMAPNFRGVGRRSLATGGFAVFGVARFSTSESPLSGQLEVKLGIGTVEGVTWTRLVCACPSGEGQGGEGVLADNGSLLPRDTE